MLDTLLTSELTKQQLVVDCIVPVILGEWTDINNYGDQIVDVSTVRLCIMCFSMSNSVVRQETF